MKRQMLKRAFSAFLAAVMVFLMVPFSAVNIVAAESSELETYDDFDLLGSGYNLLGTEALTSSHVTSKGDIFSKSFINYVNAERTTGAEASYSYTYVKDMDSYLKNQSNSMSSSISMGSKIKLFSLEAKAKMGITKKSSSSSETTSEYAVLKANKKISYSYMNLESHMKEIWENEALSDHFVEDAKNLGGSVTIESFIAKYGTHIIVGYNSGGGAMTTYENETFSYAFSESEETNTEVSVKGGYGGLIDIEGTVKGTTSQDSTVQQQGAKASAYGYSYGADGLIEWGNKGGDFGSVNDFFEKINDANSEILVDSSLKLVPIWDLLLACKNTGVNYVDTIVYNANVLKDYYDKSIKLQCAEFYSDYLGETYFHDDASEEVEEWMSEDNLQIITTAEQFNNIRNDLDGVYILANNIDLSQYENWNPIGTSESPFMGKLYGNYNTISGLNITENTGNYVGLFGYSGETASISNLRVNGTIMQSASPSTYIGGIVAYSKGDIKNCYDNVIYDVVYSSILDLHIPTREFDLSASSAQTITIGDEIGVHLIGQEGVTYTGFNIVIADSEVESPVYIILENANIVGNSVNGTVYSDNDRPIYIVSIGTTNMITGANSQPAIDANATNITFFGNAELTVKGGNGTDSDKGGDTSASSQKDAGNGIAGENGATAICCKTLNVNATGAITIIGGDGGNGGNGGNVTGKASLSGYAQLADGGNGGNGGNGGEPVGVEALNIICCESLLLQYGNGGDGGNGGKGGNADLEDGVKPDHGGNGGNGGKGGNGFISGKGGNGGNGGSSFGTKNAFDSRKGQAGDGGDAGGSGNSISSVRITNSQSEAIIGVVGSNGVIGSAGERRTDDGVTASAGSNGSPASSGIIDDSFYENYRTFIVYQYEGSEQQVLNGVISGNYSNEISYINNKSKWQDVLVDIDFITRIDYYSGDSFERNTIRVLADGKAIADYSIVFNSYCSDEVLTRTGYAKIIRDGCERYIPVYITKTIPVSLDVVEVGKVEFVVGTAFEIDGLSLKICYNNGDIEYITEEELGLTYEIPSTAYIGTKSVSITYDYDNNSRTPNVSTEYDIYVVAASIDRIEITNYPDQLTYYQGEILDMTGIKVRKIMNNGADEELDISQLSFDVFPSLCDVGTSTVTVAYAKKTATFNIEVEAKAGFDHAWNEGITTVAPSHTKSGVMTYTCTVDHCGATKTETINPIADHTYGEWYQLNDEVHQKACECGDIVEKAHVWNDGEVIIAATHTTKGSMRYTCADCSAVKDEDISPIAEHSFGAWTKYDESQHSHICECGAVEYKEHDWNEGTIAVEPTYTTTGLMAYICDDCSANKTMIIPVLEIPENAPCIFVESKNAVIGQSITVRIGLQNNTGITSMRMNVAYDSTLLTLTDVAYNTEMGGQSILPENIETLNGNIILYWANGIENYEGDDLFATLTFTISDNAAADTTALVAVTYDAEDIFDADENNVPFYCDNGTISFIDYTPGDISGDGILNSKDTTRLMKYLAGWDVEINEAAVDVNGDGVVNAKDTVRLMRYLAGWNVEIN